jgi:hypothetical protein
VLADVCAKVKSSGAQGIPSQDVRCMFGIDVQCFKLFMKRLFASGELWELKQQQRQYFVMRMYHKTVSKTDVMNYVAPPVVPSSSSSSLLGTLPEAITTTLGATSAASSMSTDDAILSVMKKGETVLAMRRRQLCDSMLKTDKIVDLRVLLRKFQLLQAENEACM